MPRRTNFVTRGARRSTSWRSSVSTGSGDAGGAQTISSTIAQLAINSGPAIADGETVVRIRGEFMAFLSAAGAALEGYHGAFGIGVGTDAAFAAGVSSFPSPTTDEDWDGWMYHRYVALQAVGIIGGSAVDDEAALNVIPASVRFEIDSKAMRKMREEELLFASLALTEVGTGSTLKWYMACRHLVKTA